VDRSRVQLDVGEGRRGAAPTAAALRRLSFYLSGAQLGITLTSLVVGFIAEPAVATVMEPAVGELVGEERALGVSIALALAIATVLQMVMGELVPKTYAVARPRATAYALARPMIVVSAILSPLIRFLNGAANATVRRLGIEPQEELASVRTLEEIELLIRASAKEGMLEPEALDLLNRTLRFGDKDAAAALVPRTAVVALSVDDTLATLAERAVSTGRSRFPVIGRDLDDVVGVVHVKDLYRVPFEARGTTPVGQVMSEPFVVPETRDLTDLLGELRRTGNHLAVVVDEHGGTAGIITLEDVLEEIVGEIHDEHDRLRPSLTRVERPGEWVVDASLHHDEVFDLCGFEVPEGDYDTLAGYVLAELGRIPEVGARIDRDPWTFVVTAMDGLRVAAVKITRTDPPTEEEASR